MRIRSLAVITPENATLRFDRSPAYRRRLLMYGDDVPDFDRAKPLTG